MAMNKQTLENGVKQEVMNAIMESLSNVGDVLQVNPFEYAIPCVDAEGNECYAKVKVSVARDSREGDPYDGYAEAEMYQLKVAADLDKKAKNEEKKAREEAERERKRQARKAKKHPAKKEEEGEGET